MKRTIPLLSSNEVSDFRRFITQGFQGGRRLKQNVGSLMSPSALNNVAQRLGFSTNAMPSELTFDQWMGLFRSAKSFHCQ
jgi:hypothetical protein